MLNTRLQENPSTLQSLIERIYIERASVALIGHDVSTVDEKGRRLVQVLRQDAHLEVVVLFDVSEDKLLERINQRLVSLSVDQARTVEGVEQPPQVWVLQVQSDAQLGVVQMLTRLVRDFPAANISVILLTTPKVAADFLETALGRLYTQWHVDDAVTTVDGQIHSQDMPADQGATEMTSVQPVSRVDQILTAMRSPKAPFAVAGIALLLLLISLVAGRN